MASFACACVCVSPSSSRLLHGSSISSLRPARLLHRRARPARCLETDKGRLDLLATTFSPGISALRLRCARPVDNQSQALRTSACHAVPAAPSPHRPSTSGGGSLVSLAVAIAIPVVSGVLASFFNSANVDWYDRLRKPSWNPPSWLFGAAWGVLYAVMGFASWLVWMQGGWDVHADALSVYVLQLVLNLAWPVLFFGAKRIRLALVDIVALWLSILACIRAFQGINLLAARLLYPYLAWVTFASLLNYKYVELNST